MLSNTSPGGAETPQVCPVCSLTPATEHHHINGTLHTDTYTCVLGHIWQVRWSEVVAA
jgi:hypothetical protein